MCCCCGGLPWCQILKYVVLALLAAYFLYLVIKVPKYRYVALMAAAAVGIGVLRLWRYLPDEQAILRQKARKLLEAQQRAIAASVEVSAAA